jgi:hypothetical protein
VTSSCAAALLAALTLAACAADPYEFEPDCEDGQCDTESRRRGHATKIRDTAAQVGLTNAVLLAGIGEVETNLAHCWSEATWACKGPASSSCNGGPVIAGAGDGSCSQKRGGLGMFQFDAGNHNDTVALYGRDIVTLEGNVSQVVPFLVERAIQSVDGINNEQDALDWMNSIPIVDGNPRFEEWLFFVSWRFNGCKGCTAQENKYRNATHRLKAELGDDFWGGGFESNNGSFVGTNCSGDSTCDFTFDGEEGRCVNWFDDDDSALRGYCSVSCQGSCPGLAGEAPTICADFPSAPASCASLPATENGFCADIEGSIPQVVPRFDGDGSSIRAHQAVCAPPGNAVSCETDAGLGGECVDTNVTGCGGTLHTGLCPGAANIRCCTP